MKLFFFILGYVIIIIIIKYGSTYSRDRPKNIWLPKRMHLDKQPYKNQNTKNQPQRYNYSSNNAISSFKQAKCCKICPLENFKKFE